MVRCNSCKRCCSKHGKSKTANKIRKYRMQHRARMSDAAAFYASSAYTDTGLNSDDEDNVRNWMRRPPRFGQPRRGVWRGYVFTCEM